MNTCRLLWNQPLRDKQQTRTSFTHTIFLTPLHTLLLNFTCMGKRSRKLPPTIGGPSRNAKAATLQPEQDAFKQLLLNIQLEGSSDSDTNDFQDTGNSSNINETTNVNKRTKTGHFQKFKKKTDDSSSEPSFSKSSPAANPTEFVTNGVSEKRHERISSKLVAK